MCPKKITVDQLADTLALSRLGADLKKKATANTVVKIHQRVKIEAAK